ncbi:hypothetical protein C8R47DRAFT_1091690 [Mycena vitilis]|nr:hypothetical protein C8R47DRAFT_1091690 [Mycena vitilis]
MEENHSAMDLTLSEDDFDDGGVADTDIDGQIKHMVAKKPQLSRWMVMSPQLMKQNEKKKREANRRKEKKAASAATGSKRKHNELSDNDDASDADTDADATGTKRKGKKKMESMSDSEDQVPVDLTGYIHILKPVANSVPTRGRTKTKPEDGYLQRGPFQFLSTCSFDSFVAAMADELPCSPSHIVLEKTEWKPQTPANRALLPLGGSKGFCVLQKQIASTKDRIVILRMPGPRKPTQELPFWSTNDDIVGNTTTASDAGPSKSRNGFDFDELEATTNAQDSVGEQKIRFDVAVAEHVEKLKETYPVNEDGKRIYTEEKTGFQWELTPIRLNIWAAHMSRGSTNEKKAPSSTQFDIKYRIKMKTPTAPAPAAPLAPLAPPQAVTAPGSSTAERLMEMLAVSLMLQQQQQQPHQPQQFVQAPAPPPAAAVVLPPAVIASPVPSLPSSPAKQMHREVSLEEFCTHYDILKHLDGIEKVAAALDVTLDSNLVEEFPRKSRPFQSLL